MSENSKKKWCDTQLLEAIRADDRASFEILYHRYWSKLYLSAFSILKDQQAVEDIIQEIFTKLWLNRHTTVIESAKAYLYTSIRYQVFKTLRNNKVRSNILTTIDFLTFNESTEAYVIEKEINTLLEESIAALPDRCRTIFILSRKEFLSVKEIATRLNISPKTVENQITIALKKLHTSMGEVLCWSLVTLPYIWNS